MAQQTILIIGPSWVGDMVMAQTLFMSLRQQNPRVIIDVLAPNWTRALLSRMPEVRQGISMPITHGQLQLTERFRMGRALARNAYDQVIVLPNSFKSALIPFWARISRRTGWRGEMRWGLLNDIRYLDKTTYPLMIERFIALGLPEGHTLPNPLPRPELQVDSHEVETALAAFNLQRDKPVLALCPGAEFGPAKRWPAEYFAEVAQHMHAQGWQVWLFGSAKDQAIAAEIQQQAHSICVDLSGQTNLAQAIDLLSVADLVVSNDSGLMHIAAALQCPLIVLYGSSSPKFTPPLTDRVEILSLNLECSPCFKRECPLEHLKCLKDLPPGRVLHSIGQLMGNPTP